LTRDPALVEAMKTDPRAASLSGRDRAIVDYALKLTREPWKLTPEDVETLRQAALSDAEILDVCQVTAYYAYVNRLAMGLGVELES